MRTRDEDFVRYRDGNDVEAMARVFDEVAPKLLLVAAHLGRDSAEAEDLVQTTLLAAIEEAHRYDAERPLLPWLLAILAHRARDAGRRARVRAAGELDPERETAGTLDPAQLVLDAELREAVASSVDALGDPYREVVLLRLLHGLAPTEIAHTLGRSPGTVRVQLQRGLERLRRALPRGLALPAFLLSDGRGLDAMKRTVLARARTTQRRVAVPVWVTLTVLLAVVALLLWRLLDDGGRTVEYAELAAVRAAASDADQVELARSSTATVSDGGARSAIESPEQRAPFVVRVVREDGTPVPDVGVHLRPARIASLGTEARTASDGTATFGELDALGDGLLLVELDRWSRPPLEVDPSGREVLELVLPAGSTLLGRVVDQDDEPVPSADLLFLHPAHPDRWMRVVRADESGAFTLRDVGAGHLIARAAGFQPSSTGQGGRGDVNGEPDREESVLLRLVRTHARLSGRVVDRRGRASPFASVQVMVDEDARAGGREARSEGGPVDSETILLRADAAGGFATDEVPPGRIALIARPLEGAGPLRTLDGRVGFEHLELAAGLDREVEVVLAEGAEIVGVITGASGLPVRGLLVHAEWKGLGVLGQPEDRLGEVLATRSATTFDDGSFRIAGLLPGSTDLAVHEDSESRALTRERLTLALGERLRKDLRVALSAELALRLVGPSSEPLAGWVARLHGVQRVTDEAGRCLLTDLQPEPGTLDLYARSARLGEPMPPDRRGRPYPPHTMPVARVHDVRPSERERLIRLTEEHLPTSALAGTVVFPEGMPERAGFELRRDAAYQGGDDESVAIGEDGAFALEELSSGAYSLVLRASAGHGRQRFGPFRIAPGERHDCGTLVVEQPARVDVLLAASDGEPIRDFRVALVPLEEARSDMSLLSLGVSWLLERVDVEDRSDRRSWPASLAEIRLASAPLAPGEYELVASGRDVALASERLVVRPGDRFERRIVCARGLRQTFVVTLGPDPLAKRVKEPGAKIHFYVRDEDGRTVVDERESLAYADPSRPVVEHAVHLAPGRYRARLEDHRRGSWSGAFTEVDFEVVAGRPPEPVRVEIRVP